VGELLGSIEAHLPVVCFHLGRKISMKAIGAPLCLCVIIAPRYQARMSQDRRSPNATVFATLGVYPVGRRLAGHTSSRTWRFPAAGLE